MAAEDDFEAFNTPEADSTGAHESDGHERDDDELVRSAAHTIAQWQAASGSPSLTQVQELLYELICAGASAMARDKIVAAIIAAFGKELGGRRALVSTWSRLALKLHPITTPVEVAASR